MKYKKILFLTVDALPQTWIEDNINLLGDDSSLSYLVNNGLSFNNAYSTGFPTQLAFPSIFSSVSPLDKHGYSDGIKYNKNKLAHILSKNGYKTIGISTTPTLSYSNGYASGYDEFQDVYNIKKIVTIAKKIKYEHCKELYRCGQISEKKFIINNISILNNILKDILYFCNKNILSIENHEFKKNIIFDQYNFSSIQGAIIKLQKQINKEGYIININDIDNIYKDLVKIFRKSTRFKFKFYKLFYAIFRRFLSLFSSILHYKDINSIYPTADYLSDIVLDKLNENKENNCFIWAHFMDVHESMNHKHRWQIVPFWKNQIKSNWAVEVNSSVKYFDSQLKKILNHLRSSNELDKCLIILTSDHGLQRSNSKRMENKCLKSFYEEYIKVPIIFFGKDLRVKSEEIICSHLDLMPTLFDLLGIENKFALNGSSLIDFKEKNRKDFFVEGLGGGDCDFSHKPIYLSIRYAQYRFFWIESSHYNKDKWILKDNWAKLGPHLYDLKNDKYQTNNLVNDIRLQDLVSFLENKCLNKCRKIRKAQINK
jgi:arylsulfatase A-like enzyme